MIEFYSGMYFYLYAENNWMLTKNCEWDGKGYFLLLLKGDFNLKYRKKIDFCILGSMMDFF